MKRTVLALALVAGISAQSHALIFGFAAPIIAGNQEVPPTSSTAYGTSSFTINDQTWAIQGTVNVWGLSPSQITGMHLHEAPVGTNGPIRFDIAANSVQFNAGTFWIYAFSGTLSTANNAVFLNTMIAGGSYINVHTAANPGGAIRGQVDCTGVVPEPATMAVLGLGVIPFLKRRRK